MTEHVVVRLNRPYLREWIPPVIIELEANHGHLYR